MSELKRWIGLIEVGPLPGCSVFEPGVIGGYATVIALASDEEDYIRVVSAEFAKYQLEIISSEDIDEYEERAARFEIADAVKCIAASLSTDHRVGIDTLYRYRSL